MSNTPIILTGEQWEMHQKLWNDYEFFARHIQMIEPKDIILDPNSEADQFIAQQFAALKDDESLAGMVPFIFRPGQRKLHAFVEEMKARRGLVMAALVKPRQVGWSTYIQGRTHWLCTKTPGLKAKIISHTKDSTEKFLRRIKKMCAASPPTVTPGRPLDNAKEIGFQNNAYISVNTAGSPDAVRGEAAHILHASEETSWEDAQGIWASVMPAMSFAIGSEAFRETTSKGRNTPWHKFILEALAKESDWEVFFDAYYNDPRYRTTPMPGWEPDAESISHAHEHRLYLGDPEKKIIDPNRLFWRSMMIKKLGSMWLFKQEFPTSIDESFQSRADTLYSPDAVYAARMNGKYNKIPLDPFAPLIMGVDPARTGDRTVIAFRQGKVFRKIFTWAKMDDMRLVGIIAKFLQEGYEKTPVAKCFIDYAIGEGAASRLRELGFFREIQTIHFGQQASEPRYANKRAEMFMDMRDWLGDTGEFAQIPDSDDVVGDLLAIPDFLQSTGSEKIKLAPKDAIKKEYGRSPDIGDAMALTFAFPVQAERVSELSQFAKQNLSHLRPNELSAILSDFDR
jgi:hypothetical protein